MSQSRPNFSAIETNEIFEKEQRNAIIQKKKSTYYSYATSHLDLRNNSKLSITTTKFSNNMVSNNFNSKDVGIAIEDILNKATMELDSELLAWMKQKFETNMQYLIGENLGDITMEIVIDSSSVISTLNYFAEGKSGLLFHLTENPIFPLCGPPLLEKEVTDYIENKAKKKYDKKKLSEGWKLLQSSITIKQPQNREAVTAATEIMKRDPKDIPFVSLVIDTGASAILAQDNDFADSVRRFTINTLGDVVGVYHRGLFSFFIMTDFVPPVLELAGRIATEIVKILFEFIALIATFAKAIIKGSVNTLSNIVSNLPNWATGVLISMVLALTLVMVIDENTRKKVISGLKSLWRKTKPSIDNITSWLVNSIDFLLDYLEKMSPYVGIIATTIVDLRKHVESLKMEIMNIKLEDAVSYS